MAGTFDLQVHLNDYIMQATLMCHISKHDVLGGLWCQDMLAGTSV